MQTAVVGMGCFWGAEKEFWQLDGVYSTAVGYAGGFTPNPTYEEVCSGRTGHTEVVLVVFDPNGDLATRACSQQFWENHDPTQGMRQGNDHGTQYRSAIYTADDAQASTARATAEAFGERLADAGLRGDHHRDRAARASSTTPRTTTSSTWRRTPAATARCTRPASAARSAC